MVNLEEFRAALQDLGSATGRRGDTFLAHITPEEADFLEQKYGGGTTNPLTGLREYAGEPGAGRGGEGSTGGGGGVGSGGGSDTGGRADRGDVRGGSQGRGPGRGGTGRGGRGESGGRGVGAGVGGVGTGESGIGAGLGSTGGLGVGAGVGPEASTDLGGSSSASPEAGRAISRALSAMLSLGFGVPPNPVDVLDPEKDVMGVPEALRDIAETVGPAINRGLTGLGIDVGHAPTSVDVADPQGPTGVDVAAPSGTPAGGGGLFSPVPPDVTLKRPDALTPPGFLGLQNAMTPIQQRSRIATFGTGGELGGFRSDPAQEYFKNIFLRSVVGEGGEIAQGAQVLPIEAQYARQAMGLDVSPDMGVEDFARALSGLPPAEQAAAMLQAFAAQQNTLREA